jgi:hypothetical protein
MLWIDAQQDATPKGKNSSKTITVISETTTLVLSFFPTLQ